MNILFRIVSIIILYTTAHIVFAASAEAVITDYQNQVSNESITLQQMISALHQEIENTSSNADKRTFYIFLGELQEQMGLYSQAITAYTAAAAINDTSSANISHSSAEQLILNAIRCSLSIGDYEQASHFLNSSIKNPTDQTIIAYTKLYNIWNALCQTDNTLQLHEPVVLLKSYITMDSMEIVKPAMLLTLYYVTGEEEWKNTLSARYPNSPETAVAQGKIATLPVPFWYFIPRLNTTKVQTSVQQQTSSDSDQIVRQQLGFFRNKQNAQDLVTRLQEQGFSAQIHEEKRASGTVYYAVTVEENSDSTMGILLKNAGFECYPVFK